MTNQHPITPSPELVDQWRKSGPADYAVNNAYERHIANQAARWGADQELEACCAEILWQEGSALAAKLRAVRRPKPPTLKEQALDELASAERLYPADWSTIRKALEALPNG
jgi:hypothetical protein